MSSVTLLLLVQHITAGIVTEGMRLFITRLLPSYFHALALLLVALRPPHAAPLRRVAVPRCVPAVAVAADSAWFACCCVTCHTMLCCVLTCMPADL
jgi:hypothetical protein